MEPTKEVTSQEGATTPVTANCGNCRWQSKSWLLTYSQSKLTKEAVQAHLQSLRPVEKLVIGEEKHQDGNTHFHAVVVYETRTNSTNPRYWDIQGEHPNVKKLSWGCQNLIRAVKYVTKEDEEPIVVGLDLDNLEKEKVGEYGRMIQAMQDGATQAQIRQQFLGSYTRCKRNVQEVIQELQMDVYKKSRLQWKGVTCNVKEIEDWLNSHIKKQLDPTNLLPQLWISGPPGVGKSSLIHFLKKYLTIFAVPKDGWLDGYEDGQYDLIVIDEFRDRQYEYTMINKLADGFEYTFAVKRSQVIKKDPLPMIICSNYSMSNTFKKVREILSPFPMDRRFLEVYVSEGTLIEIKEKDTEVVE